MARLVADEETLDRGILTYSPLATLQTGDQTDFTVSVTDVGRGPQLASAPRTYLGNIVAPQDVPTGGIVGVAITTCGDLTCQSESSTRQAVLAPGQSASWSWLITALNPGPAQISITATTYDQNSDIALHQTTVTVKLTVQATAAFKQRQQQQQKQQQAAPGGNWIGRSTTIIGTLATVASAVFAGLGVSWHRRKKVRQAATPARPVDGSSSAADPNP